MYLILSHWAIAAIALLKDLQASQRRINVQEKAILSQFNGWGAFWQVFKPDHPQHEELRQLLTSEEFAQASASILNAYYTNPGIVQGVWQAIKSMGFEIGKILEPSCGIGYFLAGNNNNDWTTVELDPIAAAIAQYLYPFATVYNQGFESVSLPKDYFDLAIGNVPFGAYSVFEPGYEGLFIHNHFISKSIDLVRPGGLIALITSTGTLDAAGNEDFRKSLAKRATLICALRLPGGTMANAKTSVTTDLLIFKKDNLGDAGWLRSNKDYKNLPLNEYFQNNPEHLLGNLSVDTMYGGRDRLALESDGRNLPEAITREVAAMGFRYEPGKPKEEELIMVPAELQSVLVGGYCIWMKDLYRRNRYQLIPIKSGGTHPEGNRVRANLKLLETLHELLERQLSETDEELVKLRKKLNKQYEEFVSQYGYVSRDVNSTEMKTDPRYGLLRSLEVDSASGSPTKAQIFTERTTRAYVVPKMCANPKDALIHCLNNKGRVDLNWIAERC